MADHPAVVAVFTTKERPIELEMTKVICSRCGKILQGDEIKDHRGICPVLNALQSQLELPILLTNAIRPITSPCHPIITPAEKRILRLVMSGLINKEIALAVNISEQTVKNHISTLLRKLGVGNRTQLTVAVLTLNRRGNHCLFVCAICQTDSCNGCEILLDAGAALAHPPQIHQYNWRK